MKISIFAAVAATALGAAMLSAPANAAPAGGLRALDAPHAGVLLARYDDGYGYHRWHRPRGPWWLRGYRDEPRWGWRRHHRWDDRYSRRDDRDDRRGDRRRRWDRD